MPEDSSVEVQNLKDSTKNKAEGLVKTVFPKRVLELQTMLDSDMLSYDRLPAIYSDLNIPVPDPTNNHVDEIEPSKKKRKLEGGEDFIRMQQGSMVLALPNGSAPSNKHIVEIVDKLKPYIRELVEHSNCVKMWITFMIPRIEDGNNFGVSVQEDILGDVVHAETEAAAFHTHIANYFITRGKMMSKLMKYPFVEDTLSEARQVETEAATCMDQMSRYFISRAKLVSKVAKYPHVDDYRRVVRELDEKQFMSLRLTVAEMRNNYCGLNDLILKNLDKIKKPRSHNAENMF